MGTMIHETELALRRALAAERKERDPEPPYGPGVALAARRAPDPEPTGREQLVNRLEETLAREYESTARWGETLVVHEPGRKFFVIVTESRS